MVKASFWYELRYELRKTISRMETRAENKLQSALTSSKPFLKYEYLLMVTCGCFVPLPWVEVYELVEPSTTVSHGQVERAIERHRRQLKVRRSDHQVLAI